MKIGNGKLEQCTLLWTKYKSKAKEITNFLNEQGIFAVVPDENTQEQDIKHRTVKIFRKDFKVATKIVKKFVKKNGIEVIFYFDSETCYIADEGVIC